MYLNGATNITDMLPLLELVLQIASTNLLVQLEIVRVHVCVRIHVCVCPKNLLVSQREQLQT
jgi:hypothetical protein